MTRATGHTRCWWIACALMLVLCTADWAWGSGHAAAAAQAQEGFEVVKPGEIQESLPATPFVFVAYAFAWAAVAYYVFWMWRRLARVEKELAEVRGRLPGPPR